MEPFLDKGRTVATDKVFTSLSLANRPPKRNTNEVQRELPLQARDASGAHRSA